MACSMSHISVLGRTSIPFLGLGRLAPLFLESVSAFGPMVEHHLKKTPMLSLEAELFQSRSCGSVRDSS